MDLSSLPDDFSLLSDESGRLSVAWRMATQAAMFLMQERPIDLQFTSKSTSTDLVSVMDKTSEQMIVDAILEHYPSDSILGEEGSDKQGTSDYRWIIDPLDGTVNYLFGIPLWGVSIAIERLGQIEFGIVVIPAQGEIFLAQRNIGSWRVEVDADADVPWHRISIRESTSTATALVMTGFGYDPVRREKQADVVKRVIPHIADIRRGGAAVVDLCWFACGRSDAYFEYGLNPWDYAAGALIAQESGGIVEGLDGPDFGKFLLAATPQVFNELRSLLKHSGAQEL
jgi:myo-inositol-1(or 4)-monophosphatase